ncbi:hypothetical protein Anapl_16503 [Anas platyrhynchos]|uniref:Uncharacterized protein n=1 Tax=Anas platyrhynchos TaxID=8839 RepID=R0KYU1_ANAPL|nr:hypothetical protein Anapl_16503 [Anas platyrhynchos]
MKAQNFACSCILALYGRLLSKSANARTEALVPAVQSSIWLAEPDNHVICQQDNASTAARHNLKFNSTPWLVARKFQCSRNIILFHQPTNFITSPHSHPRGLLRSETPRCGPKLEEEKGADKHGDETLSSAPR